MIDLGCFQWHRALFRKCDCCLRSCTLFTCLTMLVCYLCIDQGDILSVSLLSRCRYQSLLPPLDDESLKENESLSFSNDLCFYISLSFKKERREKRRGRFETVVSRAVLLTGCFRSFRARSNVFIEERDICSSTRCTEITKSKLRKTPLKNG